MTRFLLDANLSPKTAQFLTDTFGFDVVSLLTLRQGALRDEDVIALATGERRIIITLDLDFGELYYLRGQVGMGVSILRLNDQTVEWVNQTLERFFRDAAPTLELERALVIVEETRVRVVRAPGQGGHRS